MKTKKHEASFFPIDVLSNQKRVNSICKDYSDTISEVKEKPQAYISSYVSGKRDWLPEVLMNPDKVWLELSNGDMVEFRRFKVHKSKMTQDEIDKFLANDAEREK